MLQRAVDCVVDCDMSSGLHSSVSNGLDSDEEEEDQFEVCVTSGQYI